MRLYLDSHQLKQLLIMRVYHYYLFYPIMIRCATRLAIIARILHFNILWTKLIRYERRTAICRKHGTEVCVICKSTIFTIDSDVEYLTMSSAVVPIIMNQTVISDKWKPLSNIGFETHQVAFHYLLINKL
jgi:hypothetical protein